jgi:hypothetical protein
VLELAVTIEQRNGVLAAQIADKDSHARALQEQLTAALAQAGGLSTQMRELELALAQSQAKYEAQQGILADLRTYLVASERPNKDHVLYDFLAYVSFPALSRHAPVSDVWNSTPAFGFPFASSSVSVTPAQAR